MPVAVENCSVSLVGYVSASTRLGFAIERRGEKISLLRS
jgi:hypothetical protein